MSYPFEEDAHEESDVVTLREATRTIANKKTKKHGGRTIFKALRVGEIHAQVRLPESDAWVIIPKEFWFSTGREVLDDLSGPFQIRLAVLLPLLSAQIEIAQKAVAEKKTPPLNEVPELGAWVQAWARTVPGQPTPSEFAASVTELLTLLTRHSQKRLCVFLRMSDVTPYIGGSDRKKREKPGTKPTYMEENFWVTLFGFFSQIGPDLSQDDIIDQMTTWCHQTHGRDKDGEFLYGRSFVEDKVRLAYEQLSLAQGNRRIHPKVGPSDS